MKGRRSSVHYSTASVGAGAVHFLVYGRCVDNRPIHRTFSEMNRRRAVDARLRDPRKTGQALSRFSLPSLSVLRPSSVQSAPPLREFGLPSSVLERPAETVERETFAHPHVPVLMPGWLAINGRCKCSLTLAPTCVTERFPYAAKRRRLTGRTRVAARLDFHATERSLNLGRRSIRLAKSERHGLLSAKAMKAKKE